MKKVKALVWAQKWVNVWACTTPWMHYIITNEGVRHKVEMFYLPDMQRQIFYTDTFDDAKTLCQSDHSQNVEQLFEP